MAEPLRLLIVSDVHHRDADAPPKLCSHGLRLLEPIIAQAEGFDLLVDLGDRIEERGLQEDMGLARDVAGLFRQATIPRIHLMGNHDSYFLNADHWSDILQAEVGSRMLEIGGYRLIFFCPEVNNHRGKYDYQLAPLELEWLAESLQSPLPIVIFSHVPLMTGPLFANFYFHRREGRAAFTNGAEARALISQSNAILSVSGHVHWNTWNNIDGVHYVTLQSLTESFTTYPSPAAAYTVMELGDDISIDVKGLDPMQLRLPKRVGQRRWLGLR